MNFGFGLSLTMRGGVTLSAAARVSSPSISPATGPVGTVFTITPSTFAGIPTPITNGSLTQAGVDVTASIVLLVSGQYEFTSTATGSLVWSDYATNTSGPATATSTASATITPIVATISSLVVNVAPTPNEISLTTSHVGTLSWVVTASATTPTSARIVAGQTDTGAAAPASGSFAVTSPSSLTNPSFTALSNGDWYFHCVLNSATVASNTLTSSVFTITSAFTAAWQQFDGAAWLYKSTDLTSMPTNSAGLLVAITYQPSATDIGLQRELFNALTAVNKLLVVQKQTTNNMRGSTESSSDVVTYAVTATGTAMVSGTKYLILYSVNPASRADVKVINLATGLVIATGVVSAAATLGGPSAAGWVIASASAAGANQTSGQIERVMMWPNTYADATDATVQGYFHASGVLKDPSVSVAAIGTAHVSIVGANLQTGTNTGSGGNFTKTGAGTIVAGA